MPKRPFTLTMITNILYSKPILSLSFSVLIIIINLTPLFVSEHQNFAKMIIRLMMLTFLSTVCNGEDYINTPFKSSSGLYYEKIGKVLLSNSNWQFVTSIDYKGYLLFYEYLKQQSLKLEEFCRRQKNNYCQER